jgi:hypothetical protein
MGSRYIAPSVTVSKYFQIGPEQIEFDSIIVQPPIAYADSVEINEHAASHHTRVTQENLTSSISQSSKQLVHVKLLSHEIREGMSELPLMKTDLEIASTKILPMSDHLLMHIHGGGFIATSSATHEVRYRFQSIAF